MEIQEYEVKQIVPANGWYAVIEQEGEEHHCMPLALWVLVDWVNEDGFPHEKNGVFGLVFNIEGFEELAPLWPGFRGYVHESELEEGNDE